MDRPDPAARRAAPLVLTGLLAASSLLVLAPPASAAVVPTGNAALLAGALSGPSVDRTGARLQRPPAGTPTGVLDAPLSSFPTDGSTFAALTTGDVRFADDPDLSESTSGFNGGGPTPSRGPSAYDVVVHEVDVAVPASANCLTFDFAFYSEEFREFVGTRYNDAFIAELDASTWTTTGTTAEDADIDAPRNFAFDPAGSPISINAAGNTSMTEANAAGTTYDGATPLLSASTPVTPGPHTLFLSVFDQGDQSFDSAVLLDGLTIGYVPDPATQCVAGAQPKAFDLDLAPASQSLAAGGTASLEATLRDVITGSGAVVPGEDVLFTVTGANPGSGSATTGPLGTAPFSYPGPRSGLDTVTACHDADRDTTCDAGESTASATVEWRNAPPVVDAGADRSGAEGAPVALAGTATDPEGGALTSAWTATPGADVDAGATCAFAAPSSPSTSVTCDDDGTWTLTLTSRDAAGAEGSDSTLLTVANAAPQLGAVTVGAHPVPVGTAVTASAPFTDAGAHDTHTATLSWGDGTTSPATVSGGTATGSHVYAAPGVHEVCATVTDDDLASGSGCTVGYAVVYDPAAGFVTGGGTFTSPAGAYAADPSLTGKANFGFVSRYKKGVTTPDGSTNFQFSAADLHFTSTAYEWLVVSGSRATFRGTGRVNGAGDYAFTVVATDAQRGAASDAFRIKVVDRATGVVAYDNKAGAAENSSAATALSGGSIVIHG